VHLPIGEYLHRMNCAFNSKIRSLNAKDNKIKKEQAQARYVGPNSQRLLERLKDRGFKQVFDFLDTDKVFPHMYCSLSSPVFQLLTHIQYCNDQLNTSFAKNVTIL
jgi:hypothetical protein